MRIFIIWLGIFLIQKNAIACDICGCGSGSSYLGIYPEFKSKIIGIRYRNNKITNNIGLNNQATYLTNTDNFEVIECWFGWNIKKNLRIIANLPYTYIEKKYQNGTKKSKNGLSDFSLSALKKLISTFKVNKQNTAIANTVWAGVNLKIPTGNYIKKDVENNTVSTNLFQLGTGTFDANAILIYDLIINTSGLNFTSNYKFNTTNKDNYSYGNKWSTILQLYRNIDLNKKYVITPNIGCQYDFTKKDVSNKSVIKNTGGYILMSTIGLETKLKKILLGFNFQNPIKQKIGFNTAKANERFMIHFAKSI